MKQDGYGLYPSMGGAIDRRDLDSAAVSTPSVAWTSSVVSNTNAEVGIKSLTVPSASVRPPTVFRVALGLTYSTNSTPTLTVRVKFQTLVLFGFTATMPNTATASAIINVYGEAITFGADVTATSILQGPAFMQVFNALNVVTSTVNNSLGVFVSPINILGAWALDISVQWSAAAVDSTVSLNYAALTVSPALLLV